MNGGTHYDRKTRNSLFKAPCSRSISFEVSSARGETNGRNLLSRRNEAWNANVDNAGRDICERSSVMMHRACLEILGKRRARKPEKFGKHSPKGFYIYNDIKLTFLDCIVWSINQNLDRKRNFTNETLIYYYCRESRRFFRESHWTKKIFPAILRNNRIFKLIV